MYLKRLYSANKWWFAIIMLFIVVQLAMDIRQDIMLSPIFHYGMYSEVIKPQNEYIVNEIAVDGQLLQAKDFSPYEWDKISLPVKLYQAQQNWNSYVWNREIKRLMHIDDSTKYINALPVADFNAWYKNYLAGMLHKQINAVNITPTIYIFSNNALTKKPN